MPWHQSRAAEPESRMRAVRIKMLAYDDDSTCEPDHGVFTRRGWVELAAGGFRCQAAHQRVS